MAVVLGAKPEKSRCAVPLNAERKDIRAGETMKSEAQNVTRLLLFLSMWFTLHPQPAHRDPTSSGPLLYAC